MDYSKTKGTFKRVCALDPIFGRPQIGYQELPPTLEFTQVSRDTMNEHPRPTVDVSLRCVSDDAETLQRSNGS